MKWKNLQRLWRRSLEISVTNHWIQKRLKFVSVKVDSLTHITRFTKDLNMERYSKIKPIGSGTFGQAWLVESTVSKRMYALKELGVSAMSVQDRHLALNEAKILSKLKHKNIVRYKEAFVVQGKLCIAMEFAEKGKQQNINKNFVTPSLELY